MTYFLQKYHSLLIFILVVSSCSPKLYKASLLNDINGAKSILEQETAKVDVVDFGSGETPLLAAVRQNNYDMAKLLLKNKANPDFKKNNGLTPLQLTAFKGYPKMAALLLENGANPNVTYELRINQEYDIFDLITAGFSDHKNVEAGINLYLLHSLYLDGVNVQDIISNLFISMQNRVELVNQELVGRYVKQLKKENVDSTHVIIFKKAMNKLYVYNQQDVRNNLAVYQKAKQTLKNKLEGHLNSEERTVDQILHLKKIGKWLLVEPKLTDFSDMRELYIYLLKAYIEINISLQLAEEIEPDDFPIYFYKKHVGALTRVLGGMAQ